MKAVKKVLKVYNPNYNPTTKKQIKLTKELENYKPLTQTSQASLSEPVPELTQSMQSNNLSSSTNVKSQGDETHFVDYHLQNYSGVTKLDASYDKERMKSQIIKYLDKGKNLTKMFKIVNGLEHGKVSSDSNLLEGTIQYETDSEDDFNSLPDPPSANSNPVVDRYFHKFNNYRDRVKYESTKYNLFDFNIFSKSYALVDPIFFKFDNDYYSFAGCDKINRCQGHLLKWNIKEHTMTRISYIGRNFNMKKSVKSLIYNNYIVIFFRDSSVGVIDILKLKNEYYERATMTYYPFSLKNIIVDVTASGQLLILNNILEDKSVELYSFSLKSMQYTQIRFNNSKYAPDYSETSYGGISNNFLVVMNNNIYKDMDFMHVYDILRNEWVNTMSNLEGVSSQKMDSDYFENLQNMINKYSESGSDSNKQKHVSINEEHKNYDYLEYRHQTVQYYYKPKSRFSPLIFEYWGHLVIAGGCNRQFNTCLRDMYSIKLDRQVNLKYDFVYDYKINISVSLMNILPPGLIDFRQSGSFLDGTNLWVYGGRNMNDSYNLSISNVHFLTGVVYEDVINDQELTEIDKKTREENEKKLNEEKAGVELTEVKVDETKNADTAKSFRRFKALKHKKQDNKDNNQDNGGLLPWELKEIEVINNLLKEPFTNPLSDAEKIRIHKFLLSNKSIDSVRDYLIHEIIIKRMDPDLLDKHAEDDYKQMDLDKLIEQYKQSLYKKKTVSKCYNMCNQVTGNGVCREKDEKCSCRQGFGGNTCNIEFMPLKDSEDLNFDHDTETEYAIKYNIFPNLDKDFSKEICATLGNTYTLLEYIMCFDKHTGNFWFTDGETIYVYNISNNSVYSLNTETFVLQKQVWQFMHFYHGDRIESKEKPFQGYSISNYILVENNVYAFTNMFELLIFDATTKTIGFINFQKQTRGYSLDEGSYRIHLKDNGNVVVFVSQYKVYNTFDSMYSNSVFTPGVSTEEYYYDFNKVFEINPSTLTISPIDTYNHMFMPKLCKHYYGGVVHNTLYMFANACNEHYADANGKIYGLDLQTYYWKDLSDVTYKYNSLSKESPVTYIDGNKLVVLGGCSTDKPNCFRDAYTYDTVTKVIKLTKIMKMEEVGWKYSSVIDLKSYIFVIGGQNSDGIGNPSILTFERDEKCFNACGVEQQQGECKGNKCFCAPGRAGPYCEVFNRQSNHLKFMVSDLTADLEKGWFKKNNTVLSLYEQWKNNIANLLKVNYAAYSKQMALQEEQKRKNQELLETKYKNNSDENKSKEEDKENKNEENKDSNKQEHENAKDGKDHKFKHIKVRNNINNTKFDDLETDLIKNEIENDNKNITNYIKDNDVDFKAEIDSLNKKIKKMELNKFNNKINNKNIIKNKTKIYSNNKSQLNQSLSEYEDSILINSHITSDPLFPSMTSNLHNNNNDYTQSDYNNMNARFKIHKMKAADCYADCSGRGICENGVCLCHNSTGYYCQYGNGFSLFGLIMVGVLCFMLAVLLTFSTKMIYGLYKSWDEEEFNNMQEIEQEDPLEFLNNANNNGVTFGIY